jgi:molecular chaperone GrpE
MSEESTRKTEESDRPVPDSDREQGAAEEAPAGEDLDQIRRKAEERDLFLDELLRAKADLDNYRKMVKRDRPGWEAQAVRGLIKDLLPIVDNFERALESCAAGPAAGSLEEGIRLIYGMLRDFLKANAVREIEALDRPFDPQFHHAVQQVETLDPARDGAVVEVFEKGYTHGNVVVRPAQVAVAKAASGGNGADSFAAAPEDEPDSGAERPREGDDGE